MRQKAHRGHIVPPLATSRTFCYGLVGLILCSFHVTCFISKGQFAVTGEEYYGYTTRFYSAEYITQYKVPKGANPVYFCKILCLRHGQCRSFVIDHNVYCTLMSLEPCNSGRHVVEYPGRVQYDIKAGDSIEPWKTCFKSCLMEKNDCNACGRGINCHGYLCRTCVKFCWELDPLQNLSEYVFVNIPNKSHERFNIWCDQQWQRIWSGGHTEFKLHQIMKGVYKLRMKIIYKNDEEKYSYFSTVTVVSNETLSVGSILQEGDAQANNWNSPFTSRAILTPVDTNCLPFFYDVDPCPTSDTYNSPRFIWPIGNQVYDALKIVDIELWVTPE